jgi:hypothetical protein
MNRPARTLLVVCTALAAFVASSLQGKVLCFGEEGHAAVEAPHTDTPCTAEHEQHEHRGPDRGPDDRECSDISADLLAARDGHATTADLSHLHAGLAPTPPPVVLITSLRLPQRGPGLGTHPPSNGDLACLRSIIVLA